jgi:hypothetical protein
MTPLLFLALLATGEVERLTRLVAESGNLDLALDDAGH